MGARAVYLASRDARFLQQRRERCFGGMRFRFYSDFTLLYKALAPEEGPALRMKPADDTNWSLFMAMHNEAFSEVPNAETMDEAALWRLRNGRCEAGFLLYGGAPCGTYVLDFSERRPEIAAVALLEAYRGRGWGHMAMRALERRLLESGAPEAQLLLASANEAAGALYHARGYRSLRRISRWFQLLD
ncbi:MAG: GNAT family N-acetyltransferase [Clostridia bacterium]|nr:GNAT family N-acetyltransferase [Clostridia bacterium]